MMKKRKAEKHRPNQKREFQSLSQRTRKLLNLEEGFDVEFKESINGLESSDLTAFANTTSGGTILIGVKEIKTATGRQKGLIVGCKVGDKEKQKILDKAGNCTPPVHLDVFIENVAKQPFYRVEIPASPNRPHCTLSGQYSIRGDGRKSAILPKQLLNIFLESEAGRFVQQFRSATTDLTTDLADTKQKVIYEVKEIVSSLSIMQGNIQAQIHFATSNMESEISHVKKTVLKDLQSLMNTVHWMETNIQDTFKELSS